MLLLSFLLEAGSSVSDLESAVFCCFLVLGFFLWELVLWFGWWFLFWGCFVCFF